MVSEFALRVVDRGFEARSNQSNEYDLKLGFVASLVRQQPFDFLGVLWILLK